MSEKGGGWRCGWDGGKGGCLCWEGRKRGGEGKREGGGIVRGRSVVTMRWSIMGSGYYVLVDNGYNVETVGACDDGKL